ncbi:MAG TPA: thioredoxin family protein [Pseudogracilibacillus sp.]|nr:thioredoxin family protein [Pseudogracilibacillus sp.]
MKNKMVIIIVAVVVLFGGLFFVTNYKNKKVVDGSDNPYGKDKLNQQTIDSLDDPLYQNIIQPNDLEERIESGESTTVYFFSPDCVHCQRTTPVLVPLAEDNDIDLVQMNLMEFEDEKAEYDIEGTPTMVHFDNGNEVARIVGEHPEDEFQSFFDEYVND